VCGELPCDLLVSDILPTSFSPRFQNLSPSSGFVFLFWCSTLQLYTIFNFFRPLLRVFLSWSVRTFEVLWLRSHNTDAEKSLARTHVQSCLPTSISTEKKFVCESFISRYFYTWCLVFVLSLLLFTASHDHENVGRCSNSLSGADWTDLQAKAHSR
jgi:hypothetical protein